MIKDGKLFGKINILDFCVVLVILLLIVAAILKFNKFNQTSTETASTSKVSYEMYVEYVRDYTCNAMKSGDALYDSTSGKCIGTIKGVRIEPNTSFQGFSDGTMKLVEVPERYNAIITVETDALVNESGYYANNSIELKVNSLKSIENKYFKTNAKVYSIKVID